MSYCNEHGIPHSEYLSWDPEDRAKTIAYLLEQGERCTMCGTAGWEWEENRFAYMAVDNFCQGCYQKSVYSETMSNSLPGTNVKLIPVTSDLKAKMAVVGRRRREMDIEEE
jgi:hypothetical protein